MKKITQTALEHTGTFKHLFITLFLFFLLSFKITAQTFSCVGSMTLVLAEDCRKEISPSILLRGNTIGSFDDYRVMLSFGPTPYPDNFLTARDIYRAITAHVTHRVSGISCSSTLFTRDTMPPKIESPPDIVIHCSQTDAYGEPYMRVTGEPKVLFDCLTDFRINYNDETFYTACFVPFTETPPGFPEDLNFNFTLATGCSRVTVRRFLVRDFLGNTSTCRQVIYMKDASYADIIYPPKVVKTCDGSFINTEPDTMVVNGVKIAGTGRPLYKTGGALTSGFCNIQATWEDTRTQTNNGYQSIKRLWTLKNPCQNRTDTASQSIFIYDDVPSITCKIATTFQIENTKTLAVTAKQLTATVFDQCTPLNKLLLGIRKAGEGTGFPLKDTLILGCGDTSLNRVELWVKDEMGRTATCHTTVRIIDTLYYCSPPPLSIEGKLNRENTTAIKAQVVLSDVQSGALVEQPLTTDFKFTGIKRDAIYKVTPTRPKDWLNGLSTFDIALISKHILDIQPLNSPYKLIAADVNGDGDISAADMLYLRRLVLRVMDSVPRSQPWRFVPSAFVFKTPEEALTTAFPQFLMYDHPTNNINNADFLAIKTGDVNLSARENALVNAEVRDVLPSLNMTVKADKSGDIVFSSEDISVQGFQMTLNFDKTLLDILSLENIGLEGFGENNYVFFKEKGKITVSWNGKTQKGDLFKIKLKTPSSQPLQDVLQITSDLTIAEAYNAVSDIFTIKMLYKAQNTSRNNRDRNSREGGYFQLLPNVPNPFSYETTLRFNLPEADEVQLTLFDNRGRIFKTLKKTFQKGYNEIIIPFYDLPMDIAQGVLGYKIQTTQQTLVGRMVFMK